MHRPNDEMHREETPERDAPFDGAECVWDAALVRLLLEALVAEVRFD
jgi:hypothetical protein